MFRSSDRPEDRPGIEKVDRGRETGNKKGDRVAGAGSWTDKLVVFFTKKGLTRVGGACPSASCVETLGQVLQQRRGVSRAPTVGGALVVSDVPGTGGVLERI